MGFAYIIIFVQKSFRFLKKKGNVLSSLLPFFEKRKKKRKKRQRRKRKRQRKRRKEKERKER